MISQLGLRISAAFRRTMPDPFILALLLTLVTAILAVWLGFTAQRAEGVPLSTRALLLFDAWGPQGGIWELLGFAMQMCLILVTGHAVASSGPVRRVILLAADLPRSAGQAAALVALLACAAATINWGLGLIVGAYMAREVGLSMSRRGVPAHYPLLAAAGYTGLMVWHGGFSGTAPLMMSSPAGAAPLLAAAGLEALPGEPAQQHLGLEQTLVSPLNVVITGGLVVLIPLLMWAMAPRNAEQMRSADQYAGPVPVQRPPASELHPAEPLMADRERPGSIPEWLERSPVVVWLLALLLAGAFARFVSLQHASAIGLNQVNTAMLAVGLVLHGSARSYAAAIEEAARGCAGIILQFPLYAGILAMMKVSGLVQVISGWFLSIGTPGTIPVMSFVSAGIVNFFIPSGGGQWAVQGPIALKAAADAGIDPAKMVMSVAYGDQLTNMLQPFWALPLLAITGVRARDIVGYTALAMLAGFVWIALWLLIW
jgi:short-chain fatty acids transporter